MMVERVLRSMVFVGIGVAMLLAVVVAGWLVGSAAWHSPGQFFGVIGGTFAVAVLLVKLDPLWARVRRLWEISGTRGSGSS